MPLRSPENISLHGRTVTTSINGDRRRRLFRSRAIRSGNAYTYAKTYTNSEVTPYSSTGRSSPDTITPSNLATTPCRRLSQV